MLLNGKFGGVFFPNRPQIGGCSEPRQCDPRIQECPVPKSQLKRGLGQVAMLVPTFHIEPSKGYRQSPIQENPPGERRGLLSVAKRVALGFPSSLGQGRQ